MANLETRPPAEWQPEGLARPDALRVLLNATSMLLVTPNAAAVTSGILDLAGELIAADAYAVWRRVPGTNRWKAVATRGLSPNYRTEIVAGEPGDSIIQDLEVYEDVQRAERLVRFQEAYAREGIRSMMVVPLVLQGTPAGTITFYWKRQTRFSDFDQSVASALANLASAALNANDLHEETQHEKKRLTFLAEASAMLAASLDYEATLERVANLVVPHVADWCTIHIVENDKVNRLVVAHADPAQLEFAREYSRLYPEVIRPEQGLGAVLRTGVAEVYPVISDEMVAQATSDPAQLAMLRNLALTSSILVPLKTRTKVIGAIRLLAAGGDRHFTGEDLQLAEELARRAAAAIENAQLHRAVLETESQLRLSHTAARMGSWSWDIVRERVTWSDELRTLHSLSRDVEPDLQSGAELVHPDDRQRVHDEITAALASRAESLGTEHRCVTPDGRILWMQSRGAILRDEAGKATALVGITIDVTESRLAEQALRRTEKLAAAGRLAATVAHEVNNPLESLVNLIYLARQCEGLPERAGEYLTIADGELSRMAHIVRQTLGFYRESVLPVRADMAALAGEVIALYQSRAQGRSIELSVTAEPGLVALVNAGEIKQVVANLISNAIDATPAGGSIVSRVRREGDLIEIAVEDTGSGIRESNLEHLFEPFFTTKADVGTGLGLWVSKGIIEKHQGTISVRSSTEPGASGTTMTIFLPLA